MSDILEDDYQNSHVNDDLVELGPNGEWPAFYHADDCGNYCDYSCGGEWYETLPALKVAATERHERIVNSVFSIRTPLRASDGTGWRLEPGEKSLQVKPEGLLWWVIFPGGVHFDYFHVNRNDDLFERLQ